MQTDHHQTIRHIIDKSLLGTASREQEQTLREHLPACTACNEYLASSHRAIAGLGGFSFEVDPGLQQKVMAALVRQPSETKSENRQVPFLPLWWSRLIALVLTMAGSLAASRLAAPAAPVLHVPAAQIQLGLIAFWIVPSVCFFLLFLLLSVSPGKKGLSL